MKSDKDRKRKPPFPPRIVHLQDIERRLGRDGDSVSMILEALSDIAKDKAQRPHSLNQAPWSAIQDQLEAASAAIEMFERDLAVE